MVELFFQQERESRFDPVYPVAILSHPVKNSAQPSVNPLRFLCVFSASLR